MSIKSYYLGKMKKKSKPARIIDFVFFRVLLFFVLYVLFLYRTRIALSAGILSVSIVLCVSVLTMYYDHKRLKKFITDYQGKLRTQCALEKISRMSRTQFDELTAHLLRDMGLDCIPVGDGYIEQDKRAYVSVLKRYPQINSTLQDLTDICAIAAEYALDRCLVFSVTEFEKGAHELVSRIQWPEIRLYPSSRLLEIYEKYFKMPTDEEVNLIIKNEISAKKEAWRISKSNAFKSANILKYFLCAGIIYAIGLVIPSIKIYYMAFASLTLCFAFISMFLNAHKSREPNGG